ncbi:DUF4134 domain-containing protein [Vibrio crassostreae]|nr:DUF4134 domain-containing protein [Vibrio crassostreae]
MNILNNKHIILALALFSTSMSFAVDQQATADMIGKFYPLLTVIATAMGLGLLILGLVKMKKRADNPNDVKTFPMSIIVTLICGAILFNFSQSLNTVIKTFNGNTASYCMIAQETQVAGEIPKAGCWDESQSEALNDVIEKANKMNGDSAEQIRANAKLFYMTLQLLGFVYFMKGVYHLKQASEGVQNKGYLGGISTIFFSALVVDLHHTLEFVQGTLESMGISF